jgi:hypothetical protein
MRSRKIFARFLDGLLERLLLEPLVDSLAGDTDLLRGAVNRGLCCYDRERKVLPWCKPASVTFHSDCVTSKAVTVTVLGVKTCFCGILRERKE